MGVSSSSSRRDRMHRIPHTPWPATSSLPSPSPSVSVSVSVSVSASIPPSFSSCNCICTCPPNSRSSAISPTLTPHSSRTPSMPIPQHGKGNTECPHNHMHKFSSRMKHHLKHHHPHEHMIDNETEHDDTVTEEEYPESSLYRQFQSTSHICTNSTHALVSQSVPITNHIQSNVKTSIQQDDIWLSLEDILATRTASHGLFDAYPYHAFDAFLLRSHPTTRPCLCFLHAEQSFREKWLGFTPYHTSHTCKICIMILEAKQLYQTYLIPLKEFLSIEVISRLEDVGLNSTSPNQDMDVIPFIHGEMFSQAVHDIMNTLRTGPFQHFIQTRQYQALAVPTPNPQSTSTLIAA